MSFQLRSTEINPVGVRRIALEQIEKAFFGFDAQVASRHNVVHRVQKQRKTHQGLVWLDRPAMGETYTQANEPFRDKACELSELQDAKLVIAACEDSMVHFPSQVEQSTFGMIRQSLTTSHSCCWRRAEASIARRLLPEASELTDERERAVWKVCRAEIA